MDDGEWLAERFEEQRDRLRAVAYRMLGSVGEAEDAVQDAWLRASAADTSEVRNLPGWLTTVVTRVCLNMLRARERRREVPLDGPGPGPDPALPAADGGDPEREAVLAESVGLALLVVLDLLTPAERLAFVLHDMFGVPFDEIGPMLERTPAAARQLASRARRRVRGAEPGSAASPADAGRRRRVVDAYLAAVRAGDLEALVALLDPEVELRADAAAVPGGEGPVVLRGARIVAASAIASSNRARHAEPALVNGTPGVVMAPRGRLVLVLDFTTSREGLITVIDVIAAPPRLAELRLALLPE